VRRAASDLGNGAFGGLPVDELGGIVFGLEGALVFFGMKLRNLLFRACHRIVKATKRYRPRFVCPRGGNTSFRARMADIAPNDQRRVKEESSSFFLGDLMSASDSSEHSLRPIETGAAIQRVFRSATPISIR